MLQARQTSQADRGKRNLTMTYMSRYSKDDLFDMFANQAAPHQLANQSVHEIGLQLKELSSDMEDVREVASALKSMAYDMAYPDGPEDNRHKK